MWTSGKSALYTWILYLVAASVLVCLFGRLENKFSANDIHLTKRSSKARILIGQISAAGSVYTRWGRKSCPKGSRRIYKGIMASPSFAESGGGSDYQCLPEKPIWGKTLKNFQITGRLYGTEYEISNYLSQGPNGLFTTYNARRLDNQDAPCVVCQTYLPKAVIMLPGRNRCYAGWKVEYSGYLMSENFKNRRTEFVCVDKDPEVLDGGHKTESGGFLHHVQAACGSLPCPRYIQNFELTCVVCSRRPY